MEKRKIFLLMLLILFIPFACVFATDLSPIQAKTFGELIDSAASVLLYLAIFLCPAGIIVGGFMMLGAGANPSNIEKGKKIILISIVLLLLAVVIRVMSSFFAPDLSFWKSPVSVTPPDPAPVVLVAPAFTPPVVNNDALISIPINKVLNGSGNIFTFNTKPIYSISVSGNSTINSANGFARIILTDTNNKKYLIYEAMGPFDQGAKTFEYFCQETCSLNGIIPKSVDLESSGAVVSVKNLYTLEDRAGFHKKISELGPLTYAQALVSAQEDVIVSKINNYNKQKGLRWTAGKTGVSAYTYEQKRALMGVEAGKDMPNLAGFEYYKGGIYETGPASASSSLQSTSASSNLPLSFDWRNRHGKNWMTEVKDQGMCGSCWAFATVGTIEAVTNLYFNQQLNLNLSEQELVSCAEGRGCEGARLVDGPNYYGKYGISTEDCMRYVSTMKHTPSCAAKCSDRKNRVIKGPYIDYRSVAMWGTEEGIANALIKHGPLVAAIDELPHGMTLAGYETDLVGNKFIWIYKNSWGTNWGERGYMKSNTVYGAYSIETPISISYNPSLEVRCVDEDNDGYCNWGIGPKPDNCPSFCKPKLDCDDSDPVKRAYDNNFNCGTVTAPPHSDLTPPVVGEIIRPGLTTRRVMISQWPFMTVLYFWLNNVSDNIKVKNCFVVFDNGTRHVMTLTSDPCTSCSGLAYVLLTGEFPARTNIAHAECIDEARNIGRSPNKIEIYVVDPYVSDTEPPLVGKIRPTVAKRNITETFYVDVGDNVGVRECDFFINDNHKGKMRIPPGMHLICANCVQKIQYKFLEDGIYSAYAKCEDASGNMTRGKKQEIRVGSTAPVQHVTVRSIEIWNYLNENLDISKIELNEKIQFVSKVSSTSGKKISGCFLMIDNTNTGLMNLMKESCFDCEMWKEHTFAKKGIFSAYIKCVDAGGHMGESSRINITVIDKQCPALEYPSNMWQRVWYELSGAWYELSGSSRGDCLGQGLNEGSIKFDNNWGTRTLAFGKSDNIYLSSSRTINLSKTGEYTFTVGSDDGVKVWINDALVLDKWRNRAYITDTFKANLTAGNHKFRIDYYEKTHTARLSFTFQEPVDQTTKHTLTLSKTGTGGGSVKSIPLGIDCGNTCQSSFNQGTSVSLMVVANSDSNFVRWQGACSGASSSCSVNMNSDKSVTAVFEKKTQPVQETWVPCSPSPGWKCGASQGGTAPFCNGQQIGWGIFGGNDGQAICPQGHIAALGLCQGRHSNDYAIQNKEKIMMLPSSETFSSSVTFNARSAWYCQFNCNGFLCVPDGCAWAKCKQGGISVSRIELTILNWIGVLVSSTSNANQSAIAWDGKNNSGQQAGNGTYIYHIKTHLSDGRVFENTGKIRLQR